jgi:hypothetical protein
VVEQRALSGLTITVRTGEKVVVGGDQDSILLGVWVENGDNTTNTCKSDPADSSRVLFCDPA